MNRRRITALTTALALFAFLIPMAGTALGHNVSSVGGTVNCQGDYSISVTGEIYNGVHLIVKLGGVTIYDEPQNGVQTVQIFGPFIGTGATAGELIEAQTSDGSSMSANLILVPGGECPTPTPTPTPTATPTATTTGHGPSPSAMPKSSTGSPDGPGDSSTPIILFGLLLFGTGLGYAAIRRRGLLDSSRLS